MGGPGLESWSSGSWSTAPEEKTHITEGTAGPRPRPGIWIFSTNTEVTGPDTSAWGQGSRKITQASLPQATLTLAKALVAGSSWSFLEADANPVSSSVRTAPAIPQPPNRAAPASEPLGEAQPQPIPQGETWVGISLPYAPYTNKSFFPNNGSHKRKLRERPNIKRQGSFPSPLLLELSGDIKWQLPVLNLLQSILQLVFFSLCFIFSAQMEKCIGQSSSHLDPLAPHRDVTQLPVCPQPLPQRDTLIPHAFLFISCLSWRQKYWVLVSLSDFKAGGKGSFVRTDRSAWRNKGGGRGSVTSEEPA